MFDNVEKKLKTYAMVNFVCVILIALIFFFAFILELLDDGFLTAVLSLIVYVSVVYCLLASCWFMHAFAEITESVKATNKALQLTFEHNIANAEEEYKKAAAAVAESARKALAEKKAAEAEAEAARKKRFYDYWQAHAEEKAALLAKKNEAQNALDSIGELATEERAKLQSIIDAIDKELTKDR